MQIVIDGSSKSKYTIVAGRIFDEFILILWVCVFEWGVYITYGNYVFLFRVLAVHIDRNI